MKTDYHVKRFLISFNKLKMFQREIGSEEAGFNVCVLFLPLFRKLLSYARLIFVLDIKFLGVYFVAMTIREG